MFNLHRLSWITVQQSRQLSTVRVIIWNYVFTRQGSQDMSSKLSSQHSKTVSLFVFCARTCVYIIWVLTINLILHGPENL